MKKIRALALLLTGSMLILALAACGSTTSTTETAAATTAAAASASAATDTGATAASPAASAETSAATSYETVTCDPVQISFTTTFNQTETGGQIIQHFIDKVGELSNGAVTVNMYWGGTLFSDTEVLDGISSGSVNMTALGHMPHLATLNYLAFPGFAPGGTQSALDYFDELIFNNPDTSALIQGEAADNDIIYLNVIAGGANAFCSKNSFTDLQSLLDTSSSFGNMDAAIFEKLGFKVTSVGPGDTYDALQRGLVDSTQMGFAPMVSMSWYEVAPYWALDGTYTAGNMFTANLDWWNSLTADQQKVIKEASAETEDYSAGIYDDSIATDQKTVEDATGHPFVKFSQADIDKFWAACFEAKADSALETAKANGKEEGMTKILEAAAKFTGYDWQH